MSKNVDDVVGVAPVTWSEFFSKPHTSDTLSALFSSSLLPSVVYVKSQADRLRAMPAHGFKPTRVERRPLAEFVYKYVSLPSHADWVVPRAATFSWFVKRRRYVCGVSWGCVGLDHDVECWCWSGRIADNINSQVKLVVLHEDAMPLSEAVALKLSLMFLSNPARAYDFIAFSNAKAFPGPHAWLTSATELVNLHWRAGIKVVGVDPAMMDVSDSLPFSQGYDVTKMGLDVYTWMHCRTRGETFPGYRSVFNTSLDEFWRLSGSTSVVEVDGWRGNSAEEWLLEYVSSYDWVTSGGSSVKSRLSVFVTNDGRTKEVPMRSTKNTVAASVEPAELVRIVLSSPMVFKAAPKPMATKLRAVLVQDMGNYLLDAALWRPFTDAFKRVRSASKMCTTLMSSSEVVSLQRDVFSRYDVCCGDISSWDHLVTMEQIVDETVSRYRVLQQWATTGVISADQMRVAGALFKLHMDRLRTARVVVPKTYVDAELRARPGVSVHADGDVSFAWTGGQPSGRATTSDSNGAINFADQKCVWTCVRALGKGEGRTIAVQGDDLVSVADITASTAWVWCMNRGVGSIVKLKAFSATRVVKGELYCPTAFLKMFGIGSVASRSVCGIPWRNGVAFRAPWTASSEVSEESAQFGVSRMNSDVAEVRQFMSRALVCGWCRADELSGVWNCVQNRYAAFPSILSCLGGVPMFDEFADADTSQHVVWSEKMPDVVVRMTGVSTYLRSAAHVLAVSAEDLTGVVPIIKDVDTVVGRRTEKRRSDGAYKPGTALNLGHEAWSAKYPDRWWGSYVRTWPERALDFVSPEARAFLRRTDVSHAGRVMLLVDGYPTASCCSWRFSPAVVKQMAVSRRRQMVSEVTGLRSVTKPAIEAVAEHVSIQFTREVLARAQVDARVRYWSW